MKRFKVQQTCLLFVIMMMSVFLMAGCGGGGEVTGHWLPNPDSIAPMVTAVVPLNNATGVARNLKKITAAFSEDMDPATLNTVSFTLACPAGTPITGGGAVTYLAAGYIATLPLPTATDLPANTLCTATVTTAARDRAGNPLAANYTWTFRTGVVIDSTAPTVTLTVPVNAAAGVALNTKLTATFNEDMDPTTITGTTFTVVNTTLGTAVAGAVTYAVAGRTATFTPTLPATLPASSLFTATITAGAKDLAGNALVVPAVGGLPKPNPWTFTTGAALDTTPPTVILRNPLALATGVCINKTISATFSEPMDPTTITTATFTLQPTGPPLGPAVSGVITYDPLTNIATFNPNANLAANTNYTATVAGGVLGVKDVAGNALVASDVWTFTTGTTSCLPPINLGAAATFGISATAGVTNTATAPVTNIHGDVVLDPTATCNAVAIDAAGGFGLCGGPAFVPVLAGTVISSLYNPGGNMATIKADLNAAFLSLTPPAGPPAAGTMGAPTYIPTNLPAGTTLGEPTGSALVQGDNYFVPGLYQSLTSILITGDVTLDALGDANAVFVFQSSSTIGTAAGAAPPGAHTRIILIGGAKASNVWWQAGTAATLGLYSEFQGNILASGSITMLTGATSCGRLMAGSWVGGAGAFVFDSNVVSVPGQPFAPPATYSTICQ